MKNNNTPTQCPPQRQRGAGLVEYVAVTGILLGALLTPFGDGQNAVQRVTNAVKDEHAGYLYLASFPSLPRSDAALSALGDQVASNGGGGQSGGGAGGTETPGGPGNQTGPGGGGTGTGAGTGPDGQGGPGPGPGGTGEPGDTGNTGGPGDPSNPGDTGTDPGADPTDPGNQGGTGGDPGNGSPQVCGVNPPPGDDPIILAGDPRDNLPPVARRAFAGAGQYPAIAATHVGNPINVITGNKYQREVDLAGLPGAHGLAFIRHYNSRTPYTGALGHNWRHNYAVSIAPTRTGFHLWQADGRRIDFTYDHTSQRGVKHYTAAAYSDGTLAVGEFGYEWRWRDATQLSFEPHGRLMSLTDAQGRATHLAYNPAGQLTRITDPSGRRLTLEYNNHGHITRTTDPAGQTTTYRYDPHANLSQVTGPDGIVRRYHYADPNDAHNLTGISRGRLGSQPQEQPKNQSNPQIVQAAQARDAAYRPNESSQNQPHAAADRLTPGEAPLHPSRFTRIATWAYDAADRAILSEHADGVDKTTLDFQPNQTVVTDAAGRTSVYHTAIQNGVPIVTAVDGPGCDTCGATDSAYTYNGRLQLRRAAFADGSAALYAYDAAGRLVRAGYRTAAGDYRLIAKLAYAGDRGKPTRIASPSVNPDGERVIAIDYDNRDRPLKITQSGYAPQPDGGYTPIQRSQTFEYRDGRLSAIDGYRTDVDDITHIRTDGQGRLRRTTLPDGTWHAILARDSQGRPTRTQTDTGAELTLSYDDRGRPTGVSNGQGRLRVDYDDNGGIARLVANDHRVTLDHDAAGRLTRIAGAEGQQRIAYDNANHVTQGQWLAPGGKVLAARRYGYDNAGRIDNITNADGQTVKRLHYAADTGATARAHARRGAAKPVARSQAGPGAAALRPDVTHDRLGHAIAVTDARANTTEYGYDDFGNKVFTRSPDTGITQYTYDGAGNLRSTTQASGHSVQLDYDGANRLTQTAVGEGATHYTWDAGALNARLRMVRDDRSTETRLYDTQGRLTRRTRSVGRHRYTTEYHYNAAGKRTGITLPGGQTLHYQYDNHGQLSAITAAGRLWGDDAPLLTGLDHDTPGIQTLTHGNGIAATQTRIHNRLQRLTIGALHDFSYHYDRANRIVGIDDGAAVAARYRFDTQGRLDFAITPWALYGYRYDANGNRRQTVINGRHTVFDYAKHSNRLQGIARPATDWAPPLRVHTVAFTHANPTTERAAARHQATGELTQLGRQRIHYNANGQPDTLYRGDTLIAQYQYNSKAQRIAKTVYTPGQGIQANPTPHTTRFLYDHKRLVAEINADGDITRQYLYYHGRPVTILQGDNIYAVHANHLGAPIAVTNNNQTVIWKAAYAPFGKAFVDTDPDGDGQAFTLNLRLPGQYEDKESGLYYNYYRYYDPDTGRYIASDPMGLKAGLNTYAYVKNDPVNNIDPSGLLLFAFDGTNNADTDPVARQTNVVHFRDAYSGTVDEPITHLSPKYGPHWYYITGAGKDDPRSGLTAGVNDLATGSLTGERVLIMADNFFHYIDKLSSLDENNVLFTDHLDIDIVGFSRGAAEARIFANLLDRFLTGDNEFVATNGVTSNDTINFNTYQLAADAREFLNRSCFTINLRFLGLWDTVPHIGAEEVNDSIESYGPHGDAYLAIPKRVHFAAQAVAVDERREIFDAWSIFEHPDQSQAGRTEKRFVGDHSDIGGGHTDSDLSDIAFMWMVDQARRAGVPTGSGEVLDTNLFRDAEGFWNEVTRPIVHDTVFQSPSYTPSQLYLPGRDFHYLDEHDDTDVLQDEYVRFDSHDLDFEHSKDFIEKNIYADTKFFDDGQTRFKNDGLTETTLKKGPDGKYLYQQWLADNYSLHIPIHNEADEDSPDQ